MQSTILLESGIGQSICFVAREIFPLAKRLSQKPGTGVTWGLHQVWMIDDVVEAHKARKNDVANGMSTPSTGFTVKLALYQECLVSESQLWYDLVYLTHQR